MRTNETEQSVGGACWINLYYLALASELRYVEKLPSLLFLGSRQ